MLNSYCFFSLIQHIPNYYDAKPDNDDHCRHCKPFLHQRPVMEHSVAGIIRESSAQTKIKISRRRDCPEASDHPSQPGLRLVKLAARRTLLQMFHCRSAGRLFEHQFVEFSTNLFAVVFSHNFFTYK
jgi:hypothetical protein